MFPNPLAYLDDCWDIYNSEQVAPLVWCTMFFMSSLESSNLCLSLRTRYVLLAHKGDCKEFPAALLLSVLSC